MNVVVTGSSAGIGRALAERLLERGHCVWGLARSDQASLSARHPQSFRASRCDVAIWGEVESVSAAVGSAWGHLDALVTCAGIQGEIAPVATADPARWSATVRTNLDGTFHALRAFHPLLRQAPRRAKVICFSGGGASKSRPRFSAYAAAKTGVVRLVETAAEELKGEPIDLNAVAPGAVATQMTEEVLALGPGRAGAAEFAAAQKQKAAGKGSLDRALGMVEWLLSDGSDGVSGRLLAAPWDPWPGLGRRAAELESTDIYMLRRIVPEDRGKSWPA